MMPPLAKAQQIRQPCDAGAKSSARFGSRKTQGARRADAYRKRVFLWSGGAGHLRVRRDLVHGLPTRICPATKLEVVGRVSHTRNLTTIENHRPEGRPDFALINEIDDALLGMEGILFALHELASERRADEQRMLSLRVLLCAYDRELQRACAAMQRMHPPVTEDAA